MGKKVQLPSSRGTPICVYCARMYGENQPMELSELQKAWLENDEKFERFREAARYDITYNGVVHMDTTNKWFYIHQTDTKEKPLLYDFSGLLGVDFKEAGGKVISRHTGNTGGLSLGLLGPVGVFGGTTSGITVTTTKPGVQYAIITVGNRYGAKSIRISQPKIAGITAFYRLCTGEEFFDQPEGSTEKSGATAPATLSVPDEIKKYKELLDMGAITQEEFDAKKSQLLRI